MTKPIHHSSDENQSDDDILINVLLDRSGSMGGKEKDVIGQFNAYIKSQRDLPGSARVSLVLFDEHYEEVYLNQNIRSIPDLTSSKYYVRGSTALLDAVGKLVTSVDGLQNKPKKIVFVINTDGFENASREYTKAKIKELITERQNNHDWQFVFIGAGIDAFSEGGSLGVRWGSTYTTTNDSRGYFMSGQTLASATTLYRSGISDTVNMQDVPDVIVPPIDKPSKKKKTTTVNP